MQNGQASLVNALQEIGWPAKAAADLARSAHIVPYDKRSIIFHAGETADLVYVLISGEVKLLFDAGGGAGVLVSIARAGQMVGVFAPDGSHSARSEQLFNAEALSRCKMAIIPTARAAQALHRLPAEQLVRVLEHNREQWTRLCCRLLTFMTMTVRQRLLCAIDEIADTFGVADARGRLITLRLSHEDLAALVGASRPMVSKHLTELASHGVLTKEQGRYVVLQAGLAAAAGGGAEDAIHGNGARRRRTLPAPDQTTGRGGAGRRPGGAGQSGDDFRFAAPRPARE